MVQGTSAYTPILTSILSGMVIPSRAETVVADPTTLREESSQTNVILQYKLLATILNAVWSVSQQS